MTSGQFALLGAVLGAIAGEVFASHSAGLGPIIGAAAGLLLFWMLGPVAPRNIGKRR